MGLNIRMIRESFELAKPAADQLAERFYINLWTDEPMSKVLFEGIDMGKQKKALIGALGQIVDNLDDPAKLSEYLQAMGARHLYYGAEEHHYDWVGAALLKTFGEFFGEYWSPALVEQWTMAYQLIADTMKEGAKAQKARELEKPRGKPQLRKVENTVQEDQEAAISQQVSSGNHEDPIKITVELPHTMREKIRVAVQSAVDAVIENEIRSALQNVERKLEKEGLMGTLTKKSS